MSAVKPKTPSKKNAQSIEPNIADMVNGWLKGYKLDLCTRQK